MAADKKKTARAKSPAPLDLPAIRVEIDGIDQKLQELLNQRAKLAQKVGISKHADGHTVDFYRPEREAVRGQIRIAP